MIPKSELKKNQKIMVKTIGTSKQEIKRIRKMIKIKGIMGQICNVCNSIIDSKNKLLICKYCNKEFCEECEKKIPKENSFYDGFETRNIHSEYPLCESCYGSDLNKQKELLTMHRRFLQLRESLPLEPEIWYSTAEQFKTSGLFDLARLCYNEAINVDEGYINKIARTWESEGIKLINESQYQKAVECFDEALSLDLNSEIAWLNRGKALEKLDKIDDVFVSLSKVLLINDQNLEAWCFKGLLLAKLNNANDSRKCFIKAVNIDPNSEMVWQYKLQSHSLFKEFPEIVKCADYMLGINPDSEFAWSMKCEGLINLNDFGNAIQCCDELIKRYPMNPLGWKFKGDILIKLGKFKDAVMTYDKALTLDPEGSEINIEEVQ